MLPNYLYNLMLQLTQENKSLWRIKNEYLKDAAECGDECTAFWMALAAEKEKHVNDLTALVKKNLNK